MIQQLVKSPRREAGFRKMVPAGLSFLAYTLQQADDDEAGESAPRR